MADIASTDVTYTLVKKTIGESGYRNNVLTVAFGNSTLTYPSGGIPLDKNKLGVPNQIISLQIFGPASADGMVYKYDAANNKIRLYRAPAQTHAHDLLVKGGQIGSTTNDIAHYATDILGKEAATDATIAGSASATKGGVISSTLAVANLTENAAAPAACTLYVEVLGW